MLGLRVWKSLCVKKKDFSSLNQASWAQRGLSVSLHFCYKWDSDIRRICITWAQLRNTEPQACSYFWMTVYTLSRITADLNERQIQKYNLLDSFASCVLLPFQHEHVDNEHEGVTTGVHSLDSRWHKSISTSLTVCNKVCLDDKRDTCVSVCVCVLVKVCISWSREDLQEAFSLSTLWV